MKPTMFACAAVLFLALPARADDKQPAGGMDMSKMGPWTRKPTNEAKTKKEVTDFLKGEEEIMKKGDLEAALAHADFPLYMYTDDAKGTPEGDLWTREKYAAMMKPFYENQPKDMKTTHRPTITVLSDSLVVVVDEFTMTTGKTKLSGRNSSVLVKRDGQWKWKVLGEAGWGGSMAPQ